MLMPMSIGFVLLIIGLIQLQREKFKSGKYFVFASFVWFLLVSYPLISNLLLAPLENQYPKFTKSEINIKYVVVLGNGFKVDDKFPMSSKLATCQRSSC
jgi:uncharacterized SAM-binding protein YcdF (DUF218 family)